MRVLAITNMYPTIDCPGSGVFVREQIRGLRSAGLQVEVLFVDRRHEGALAYYRLPGLVRPAVADFEPDVVHVMYGGVMADQVVRHQHDRPVVITFHGSDLLGENLSGWKRKWISRYGILCSRRAARSADGIVVVARHLIGALKGAVPRERIRIIPCGIDLKRFHLLDPADCKRRLNWNKLTFHVLFASGNGDPVKRPWLAEAAVKEMRRGGQPVELHHLSGVSNAEVPTWLNASDALLLTSLHEGSPTIVKEALACGLPVVSVDVGDVSERIGGIVGCHLARPDPADLAARLAWVKRRGRRLDCRNQLDELSIESSAAKLKRLYEDVLATSGSPRPVRSHPPVRGRSVSHTNLYARFDR